MKTKLHYLLLIFIIFSCENDENLAENKNQFELSQVKSTLTSKFSNTSENLPMILPDNFIWGINGHPATQSAYIDRGSTIDMQFDLINEHLLSYYRVDISTNSAGNLITPPFRQSKFDELVQNLPNNVKLLPVLRFSSFDFESTEEQLYERAVIQGKGFTDTYGNFFETIAIGNEEELRCTKEDLGGNCIKQVLLKDTNGNDQSGNLESHYDIPYLKK